MKNGENTKKIKNNKEKTKKNKEQKGNNEGKIKKIRGALCGPWVRSLMRPMGWPAGWPLTF